MSCQAETTIQSFARTLSVDKNSDLRLCQFRLSLLAWHDETTRAHGDGFHVNNGSSEAPRPPETPSHARSTRSGPWRSQLHSALGFAGIAETRLSIANHAACSEFWSSAFSRYVVKEE